MWTFDVFAMESRKGMVVVNLDGACWVDEWDAAQSGMSVKVRGEHHTSK